MFDFILDAGKSFAVSLGKSLFSSGKKKSSGQSAGFAKQLQQTQKYAGASYAELKKQSIRDATRAIQQGLPLEKLPKKAQDTRRQQMAIKQEYANLSNEVMREVGGSTLSRLSKNADKLGRQDIVAEVNKVLASLTPTYRLGTEDAKAVSTIDIG